jgi:hypothetical protein
VSGQIINIANPIFAMDRYAPAPLHWVLAGPQSRPFMHDAEHGCPTLLETSDPKFNIVFVQVANCVFLIHK